MTERRKAERNTIASTAEKRPCQREECPLHNIVHTGCVGHVSNQDSERFGKPCGNQPLRGMTVCAKHGGKAPALQRNAKRRLALKAAEEAVRTLGLPRNIAPVDALLEEVRWTAGHVEWLRAKVQELDEADLVWGTTEQVDKQSGEFKGIDTTKAAAPSVWYELYLKERAHLVVVTVAAIRAGIDERAVRVAERQGHLVSEMLKGLFASLFDVVVGVLRAHGVPDEVILTALSVRWQEFLQTKVPDELRALGRLEQGQVISR